MYVTPLISSVRFRVDLVPVDRYDLPLHLFVPHEEVGQVAVLQQGEEVYS